MGDMGRVNGFTPEQIHEARVLALHYQRIGWQCLPSRPDEKRPLMGYAEYWNGGLPGVETLWARHPSGNVQVMTGRYEWSDKAPGLCVIDLDGPEGIEQFSKWCVDRNLRDVFTWTVVNDRTNGRHLWFTLPKWAKYGPPIRKRRLWGIWDESARDGKGDWTKRANIELLCDKALAMAPPSIHPTKPGKRYQFLKGRGPRDLARPAPIPQWLLTMEAATGPRPEPNLIQMARGERKSVEWDGEWLPRGITPKTIREAILDKVGLVRTWGVRVVDKPANVMGWQECHAISRLDSDPSASFNPNTGRYWEAGWNGDESICLYRLGVERGIYATWHEACIDLGRTYLPEHFKGKKSG